jgi:hypothetical protein
MQLISLFLDTVKMQKSKLCWSNEKVICMFVRWIEKKSFSFFPEKFISLFAPSVSTVARVVASGKTIIYLSPTFSTVNGPYQISGQCLEGERNFFLFFLLSKHFYLDETNKLWLFFITLWLHIIFGFFDSWLFVLSISVIQKKKIFCGCCCCLFLQVFAFILFRREIFLSFCISNL